MAQSCPRFQSFGQLPHHPPGKSVKNTLYSISIFREGGNKQTTTTNLWGIRTLHHLPTSFPSIVSVRTSLFSPFSFFFYKLVAVYFIEHKFWTMYNNFTYTKQRCLQEVFQKIISTIKSFTTSSVSLQRT